MAITKTDAVAPQLVLNILESDEQYEGIVNPSDTEIYLTPDNVEEELAGKQDKLTSENAGTNITITEVDGKVKISSTGGSSIAKFPNAVITGDLTINHGQTTGFSQTSYLALPFVFNTKNKGFELHYAFKTDETDVTTPQNLFGSKFCIASYISGGKLWVRVSSNGTSWDALDIETTLDVQANTIYYIKLESNLLSYTISASTDGVTYNQIGYKVSTLQPKPGDVFIGVGNNNNNPFLGMIDLNYWWLKISGETIWEGMGESGLSTRADISLSNLDEDGEARFTAKQDKLTSDNAGTNITITEENGVVKINASGGSTVSIDGTTITNNSSNQIQASGTVNQNTNDTNNKVVYDWVGTSAEYTAQNIETQHPTWVCFITDDSTTPSSSKNYEDLNNKPKINGVEISGNKSLSDLGVAAAPTYDASKKALVFG